MHVQNSIERLRVVERHRGHRPCVLAHFAGDDRVVKALPHNTACAHPIRAFIQQRKYIGTVFTIERRFGRLFEHRFRRHHNAGHFHASHLCAVAAVSLLQFPIERRLRQIAEIAVEHFGLHVDIQIETA